MAEDWASDVRKYVPDADADVIAGIIRYCGIALRNRDSSLVAFSDPTETDRVRENFLKKKLALVDPDSVLDAAIASVGERMKADRTKNRVTVYYLLADAFGKLPMFISAKAAKAREAAGGAAAPAVLFDAPPAAAAPEPVMPQPVEPAPMMPDPMPLAAAPPPAAPPPTAPPPVVPPPVVPPPVVPPGPPVNVVPLAVASAAAVVPQQRVAAARVPLTSLIPLAVLVLGGAGVYTLVAKAPPAPEVAAVVAAPVPAGAGVVTSSVGGKPLASVYFDTAKTDVHPDIVPAAAMMQAWLVANPAGRLVVSGFADPRGSAELNAELSKQRAQAVQAALVAQGVSLERTELRKPADVTAEAGSLENGRRVDIMAE